MMNLEDSKKEKSGRPTASSEAALHRMKAAKPRDTAPEMALRSALHRKGLRFRVDQKPIPELNRKADILFRSVKLAIFVDGCFWHGCPIHGTQAKANANFWKTKIERNQARDLDTTHQLIQAGWNVIRVWEHEEVETTAEKIYSIVINSTKLKNLKA